MQTSFVRVLTSVEIHAYVAEEQGWVTIQQNFRAFLTGSQSMVFV